MFLADYHLHSEYSFDSVEKIDNICKKAIYEGFNEIAVTDHMDIYTTLPFDDGIDFEAQQKAVFEAKEKYRGRLSVKSGIELGQPQANRTEAEKFYNRYKLDFIIGSIHNVKNDSDVAFYDFNKTDCNNVYREYMAELFILAEGFDFDVMGHLTYPLRYMYLYGGKTVDMSLFRDDFKRLFKILIQKGKGIEINTSGLRQEIGKTFPDIDIIKLYKECGGEIITVGSDAHCAEDVCKGIREGQEMLKEAGFEYITVFEKRKSEFVRI